VRRNKMRKYKDLFDYTIKKIKKNKIEEIPIKAVEVEYSYNIEYCRCLQEDDYDWNMHKHWKE
jgi:hypothetical protein